jgi:peptidoglycan glycosyltransferase
VNAILTRPRDVRITIDAQLQDAAASILARAARTSGAGRGAVVVLDADTGQILASVSYPWVGTGVGTGVGSDPLLDRARYGLYPPGSTFKMITAAAALRENPGFDQKAFVCQRLPSNRIGIRIPGFGPPIHDDVEDTHPHGRIAMHDAVVRSCNAYFAQLAVAIGSEALTRTAAAAGITVNSSRSTARIRANLPHAGYGQGEVLLTPLRLARVTAALGTDGTIREAPLFGRAVAATAASAPPIETPFVSPEAAKTLAGYLRDAVTNGTGRLLKDHPVRIAGKTGTAEVDEAAPHAWFTGVAPYGPATRRIAFAVVLEHAGYGGAAAANVAGQIVTAAAAMGLAK